MEPDPFRALVVYDGVIPGFVCGEKDSVDSLEELGYFVMGDGEYEKGIILKEVLICGDWHCDGGAGGKRNVC